MQTDAKSTTCDVLFVTDVHSSDIVLCRCVINDMLHMSSTCVVRQYAGHVLQTAAWGSVKAQEHHSQQVRLSCSLRRCGFRRTILQNVSTHRWTQGWTGEVLQVPLYTGWVMHMLLGRLVSPILRILLLLTHSEHFVEYVLTFLSFFNVLGFCIYSAQVMLQQARITLTLG